jgi:lysophospholipase L1-like esterase
VRRAPLLMSAATAATAAALLAVLVAALSVVPAAPRQRPGPAAPLRVVALGDSVVAGTACRCAAFVERYADLVGPRTPAGVRAVNEGRPGLTARQLVDQLSPGTPVAREVARADVVLVTVGANDLQPALDAWRSGGCAAGCQADAVAAMRSDLGTALHRLRALASKAPPSVLVTDYWNVFADGDVARRAAGPAYLAWSDAITRRANTAICGTARQAGARCVDLYRPFKADGTADPTDLLADDGDHPDARGHDLIARVLAEAPVPVPQPAPVPVRACAGGPCAPRGPGLW